MIAVLPEKYAATNEILSPSQDSDIPCFLGGGPECPVTHERFHGPRHWVYEALAVYGVGHTLNPFPVPLVIAKMANPLHDRP